MKGYITSERGQVGIGTLIVFIALVLVAAIAAGVLINTAGFLQTQAEETGQDSTDQVADNINVIGEVGEVSDGEVDTAEFPDHQDIDEDQLAIYETRLTVQRSPGSDDVDLTGLSVQYVGESGFANLIHISEIDAGDTAENIYLIQEITAESDQDAVMTDDGDRYEIVIPQGYDIDNAGDSGVAEIPDSDDDDDVEVDFVTDDTDFDNTDLDLLTESDEVELEITTDAGSQRNVALAVPDSLIGEEDGTVTL